jgi:copper oxidase (laccase) domain-containing protein
MGKKRFGIIHAGRKWLKDGIIQKMFSQLIEKEETSFSVFIWLSIRKCCYEVGKEFTTYFEPKYLSFIDEEHYMLDMIAVIQDICLQYSINKLHIHLDCTKCSPKFFSYRELWNWDYYNIVMIEKNS